MSTQINFDPSEADADIMDETADYIEEHGWTQGMLYEHATGKVCLMGGLLDMYNNGTMVASFYNSNDVKRVLGKVLRAAGKSPLGSSAEWNDSLPRNTGKQTVLDALRNAAKIERGLDPDAA